MPNRRRYLLYLAAALLLFIACVLNVIVDGDVALSALLDPARANASDWKKVASIGFPLAAWIGFGLAGYFEWRKSSVEP